MYRVLIADDEELELKAMHFFLERNYPEAVLLPDAQDGTIISSTSPDSFRYPSSSMADEV